MWPLLRVLSVFGLVFAGFVQGAESTPKDEFQLQNAESQAGDRPFVEFRARADDSHAFVVVGRQRGGETIYTSAFGFYAQGTTVKAVFYGPGEVEGDSPTMGDAKFHTWVSEEQSRRVVFAAKHINTEGKIYSLPLQTCVSFARDIARALDLDVGDSPPAPNPDPNLLFPPDASVILTPHQLIEYLQRHNVGDKPITAARVHLENRAVELQSQSAQELQILRTTPDRGPNYNPVGNSRVESGGTGALPVLTPQSSPSDIKAWIENQIER